MRLLAKYVQLLEKKLWLLNKKTKALIISLLVLLIHRTLLILLNSRNLHSSLNSFQSTPQNISNSQNLSSNFSFQNQNTKKSVGKNSISSDEFRQNSEIISGEFNLGGRNSITSQSRFFPHQNSSGDEASLNGFGELSIEEDLIKNERISTKLAELRKKYPDISEQALMDIFTQGLFESNKQ